MKTLSAFSALILVAGSIAAAEPKDEVQNAAKALGEKNSYSWKTTVNNLVQSRFRQGPTEGKTEKGGFTKIAMSFGDNSVEAVIKGEKGAIKTQNGWQSLTEATENSDQQNAGRFFARSLLAFKTPAEQAADLATKTYGISKSGDVYSGDLNQEAIKQLMSFGRRPSTATDAKTPEPMLRDTAGTVKFWIKDGVLTKFEYAVKGFVSFGGSERSVDRATTVEISDVDSTKVDVPEEALGKAS
jgi:hypothetical protein